MPLVEAEPAHPSRGPSTRAERHYFVKKTAGGMAASLPRVEVGADGLTDRASRKPDSGERALHLTEGWNCPLAMQLAQANAETASLDVERRMPLSLRELHCSPT